MRRRLDAAGAGRNCDCLRRPGAEKREMTRQHMISEMPLQ
jgi:hypothetical protein